MCTSLSFMSLPLKFVSFLHKFCQAFLHVVAWLWSGCLVVCFYTFCNESDDNQNFDWTISKAVSPVIFIHWVQKQSNASVGHWKHNLLSLMLYIPPCLCLKPAIGQTGQRLSWHLSCRLITAVDLLQQRHVRFVLFILQHLVEFYSSQSCQSMKLYLSSESKNKKTYLDGMMKLCLVLYIYEIFFNWSVFATIVYSSCSCWFPIFLHLDYLWCHLMLT